MRPCPADGTWYWVLTAAGSLLQWAELENPQGGQIASRWGRAMGMGTGPWGDGWGQARVTLVLGAAVDGWERDGNGCSQVLITSMTELCCFPFPWKQSSFCLLLTAEVKGVRSCRDTGPGQGEPVQGGQPRALEMGCNNHSCTNCGSVSASTLQPQLRALCCAPRAMGGLKQQLRDVWLCLSLHAIPVCQQCCSSRSALLYLG